MKAARRFQTARRMSYEDENGLGKRLSGSKPLSRWKQWTAGISAGKTLDLIYIFQK
jgi:hypothetical protein